MSAKFTPGPWQYSRGAQTFGVVWAGQIAVASVSCNQFECDEQRANGHLIAAAPEMYHMLRDLAIADRDGRGHVHPTAATVAEARALIARIDGGDK